MHCYQIIIEIHKNFGIYFLPSTIYHLLNTLEKNDFVNSEWNMNYEKPRKIYKLTSNGQNTLNLNEKARKLICQKIATKTNTEYDP
jgi:DNA-binding PadR family transcriptional regulator